MSIVQTAPGGWEFQYTATALIGLAQLSKPNATLRVEPKGGEDAEITFSSAGNDILVIEVQTKSSKSDVGLPELATFLTHFPDGLSTRNLLARLMYDQNRVALFIVGGRCNDATKDFATEIGNIEPHAVCPLGQRALKKLVEESSEVYHSPAPSKMDIDRLAFCENIAALLISHSGSAADLLRRVLIWEKVQKLDLEQIIERQLSQSHLVPTTRTRDARLDLLEAVRYARDHGDDLFPKLREVTGRFAGTSLLSESYLHRGLEPFLLKELMERNVILLEGQLTRSLPDTYGMALAQFLIEATQKVPGIRAGLSAYLLAHEDSAFFLYTVEEYLSHWTDLTAKERETLLNLCHSGRTDTRWIQALALTRESAPVEVVHEITGVDVISTLSAPELSALLPSELLQDCLHVYTGHYSVLSYLGFLYQTDDPWHQILEYSAMNPNSPHFDLALHEMLWFSLNGSKQWPNAHRVWAQLCDYADATLRERLFAELLEATIQINSNCAGVFWRVFLNRIKDNNEMYDYIQRIVVNIESLESSSESLWKRFGNNRFESQILPKLEGDYLAFEFLKLARGANLNAAVQNAIISTLDIIYQKSVPRLHLMHEVILAHLKAHNGTAEILAHVEAARRQTIKKAFTQQTQFKRSVKDDLPGWVSWRKD